MIRKIIQIDENKCNGCGACAKACHEGAIQMVNGKARLMRDDYCDGLGDCLPTCQADAITFVEREAAPYDHIAVMKNKQAVFADKNASTPHTCPGSMAREIQHDCPGTMANEIQHDRKEKEKTDFSLTSQLSQWPVQIKLVSEGAAYFEGCRLLIAADCTAYAYANIHEDFIKGHVTLIGCPKLDFVDYAEKLTELFRRNHIQSITVLRMEVPCCGGLENAVKTAIKNSGNLIPCNVVTISIDGNILD